ncbi:uncharacterized protein NECHADRAFT_78075 [Fusarium vanettenii 77-13-4]|uniref:Uncharacterized protein n=1 Tax=Fusarium vanettenii (strain ATCC MYA-4622 / CBS 123669 / FGSC 9596 / NRRL 45880 / 77-13-4) TaxID=660122 RepID=C7YN18_FUSV7|nr:uncharacterized protein NECHADRAFT_78075 [Fusarium vanettenii 77-13-4]EEU47543.1 hypothetical protein NECHADRAFT_78075 [Fusarium vanettenii 77-13-4]
MTKETRRWALARRRPTLCMISDHSHFSYSDSTSNGIAILFFGWAYILCMSMLEKQHIPMCYPDSIPTPPPTQDHCSDGRELTVDIGHVSEGEFLWWTSLLSPGQGWRSASGKHPAWAITYTGNIKLRVEAKVVPSAGLNASPPSSRQAVRFLSRFASMYDLDGQAPLALAMALTLPLHNETTSVVKLPRPILTRQDTPRASLSSIEREYKSLTHYMTLSSNPIFLSSVLWAVFWEPGVECNLVSPWYDAIINIVKPLINRGELEMLGHILALRRPNVAPLWYGIAAYGQTKTILSIVPFLQNLFTPVPSRPIPEVAVDELELPMRMHINCDRHQWAYVRWTWALSNGIVSTETWSPQDSFSLFESESPVDLAHGSLPDPVYKPDHIASERAVGDIFRWSATEIEPTGKNIYLHPWVDALADLEMDGNNEVDSSSDAQQDSSDSPIKRIKDWITKIDAECV